MKFSNWMLGLSLANFMCATYNFLAGNVFLAFFNLGAGALCWPGKDDK